MSVQLYLVIFVLITFLTLIFSSVTTYSVMKKDFQNKIKLDVTLEQMIESENRISKFCIDNNIKAGEPLSKIAKILNVEQGGMDRSISGQACLKEVGVSQKKVVVFKNKLSEKEKNFVFAHEIAHLLNGDSIPVTRPNGRNKSEREQIADYTAAALLMPMDAVYHFLIQNNYINSTVKERKKMLYMLCNQYHVTEMIVLRRIKEVCAVKQLVQ